MRPYPTVVSAALGLTIVMAAGTALAESPGAPTESDIGKALAPKSRGLPTLGTLPQPPSNPAIEPTATAPPPTHNPPPKHPTQVSAPADAHPSATLRTVQFQFGSAQLTPDSIETLKNLGNALNHELADQAHFRIEGHTDAYGEAGLNDKLSMERAQAVKDYLVKEMGVADGRLEAVGMGSSEPVQGSSPYSAVNRRVVVVNLEG
jgi:outer membrane protein OmpA-like peptidoglycan-associated protein